MADEASAKPERSAAAVEGGPEAKGDDGAGKREAGAAGSTKGAKAAGGKASKDKTPGKGKGTAPSPGASGPGDGPSLTLAGHPGAVRGVARAKAWGGLVGFVLGGYLSLPTHALAEAGLRALIAGVVCYVVAWATAVFVWRRLVVAELSHARQELVASELAKLASGQPAAAALERPRAGAPS